MLLCTGTLAGDTASCASTTAPIGTDTITATYNGDGASAQSSGTITVTVSRATPTLTCARMSGTGAGSIKLALRAGLHHEPDGVGAGLPAGIGWHPDLEP